MGGKAGNISGSQISVSALDPTHYDASFGKVQAGDVQWKDSSLGSLSYTIKPMPIYEMVR